VAQEDARTLAVAVEEERQVRRLKPRLTSGYEDAEGMLADEPVQDLG
jgi:hypothetical protein